MQRNIDGCVERALKVARRLEHSDGVEMPQKKKVQIR